MRMSTDSYNKMNLLAGQCFNANAIIDNLSYNLFYYYYNQIGEIVHLRVAHVMPQWSDLITDKMLELSARPVRKDINGYEENYENLSQIFEVLHKTILEIRNATRSLIESADMEGDDEVRIFGEDFLAAHVSSMLKQTEEWMYVADKIDPYTLNIHIKEYTHFIAL